MTVRRIVCVVVVGSAMFIVPLRADEPGRIDSAEFEKLHSMIKPQSGESRWMEIDWYPSVWEARQKAAAEGKPLFLMAGSGGAPAAGC